MSKRISVRDVAREAGVSIGSVSRVLNGGPNVSELLRTRVFAVVERLGYRANVHARGLRMGSSRIVGCMVPEIRNQLYSSFVGAVESSLHEKGYMLLLGSSRGDVERERELLGFFESHGVDGIITTPSAENEAFVQGPFGRSQTPMVIVDREVAGTRDSVLIDQRGGARQAVEHLLLLGHRRIALFTAGVGARSGRERLAGYREALAAAGLPIDENLIRPVVSWMQSSFDDMHALLRLPSPPTAVIAPATRILSGALKAARVAGLTVPQDLSAIAIGPTDAVEFSMPPLTAVRWDIEASGRLASQLLLERLKDPGAPMRRIMLDTELSLGQSCAPLKQSAAPRARKTARAA
ncbi:substrate-binding domain-containing protein [Variovorax sp.]|uniref:LacI family DNA-binding transcriptional regulator n=1 Tax=Variovorax sp. TaxID=1871043 RepID=UPI0013858F5E|nr:substrate-binding domain-containing protein [Variovorax sp.]KAF1067586.1 MAG: HTH-type transcriptional regulator DegA [Variovorax sp.]